jgi:hypothetical protein
MIRYALVCNKRHTFESWFSNSAAYDKQAKRGLVACPVCGSVKVEKAIMRPRLARTDTTAQAAQAEPTPPTPPPALAPTGTAAEDASPAPVAMISPQEREMRHRLKELRDHLVANAENVGPRFPEEARKMHYGEVEHRSIYGVASAEDARELHEEGVEFSPLPMLPDERN